MHDSFIASIIVAPDDDAPRLIYADYLEENGDGARAEFIRLQIELARIEANYKKAAPDMDWGDDETLIPNCTCNGRIKCWVCAAVNEWNAKAERLRARERELLSDHGFRWSDGLVGEARTRNVGANGDSLMVDYIFPNGTGTNVFWLYFQRGFIDRIDLPWQQWAEHADAIRAATPLQDVHLTTPPTFEAERVVDGQRIGPVIYVPNLSLRWPGITFHLPPAFTPLSGWQVVPQDFQVGFAESEWQPPDGLISGDVHISGVWNGAPLIEQPSEPRRYVPPNLRTDAVRKRPNRAERRQKRV